MTDRLAERLAGRTPWRWEPGLHWPSVAIVFAIVVVGLALEIGLEGHDAFWLDESWSGAIVSQTGWRATFQQIYWDVNAPLYYLALKLWSLGFGLSDATLRAPSLICAAGVPLAAALIPTPGLSRAQRLVWAALLAWWFPTLCYAEEARCYAMLLLICTLQTAAFMRLMQAPNLRRALPWAVLAALAIATHYDALYLGAAQGVAYLARHGRRAVRSWPAALAFAPAFGWLAFHWPRISQFTRPGIAWYSPLTLQDLPLIGGYLADGGGLMPRWLAALEFSALSLRLLPLPKRSASASPQGPVFWAVASAAFAAAVLVAMGFARPSFTFRYLTPSAPGLLLGLVWLTGALAGRSAARIALAALAVLYLGVSGWMLGHRLRMAPRRYNFEVASQAIARSRPERLVFLWDHPVDPILHPEQLRALGGFFLRRDGLAIPVDAVVLKPQQDPNVRLLDEANSPRTAILWLYDEVVQGTAAIQHPPDISERDPAFRCRNFGSQRFGVLACTKAP